jgi:hypothetical protein
VALTETQKRWAIGGGIGALVLGVLFYRPAFGAPHQLHGDASGHRKRKKHPHARKDQGEDGRGGNGNGENGNGENERGEYGREKHHHKGHKQHG